MNIISPFCLRSIWIRQRCAVWWEHAFTSWTDCEWKLHFRMRETTYLQPCNLLWPHLQRETTTFRKSVPVEQCIAICIWRLALNVEFGTIPHLFGIGQSTAVTIANHVASVIVNNLFSLYIRTPSEQEIKVIIQGFRDRWGFRQCGGAIDGTRIGILAPRDSPADYYSYKVSIRSSCKVWLTIVFGSGTSLLVGQAKSILPECSAIHPCTRGIRGVHCSLISEVCRSRCESGDVWWCSISTTAMVDEIIPWKPTNNRCTDHL